MIDSKLINGQYKILEQATKDARIIAGLAFARKIYYEPYELNVLYPLPPKIHKKK